MFKNSHHVLRIFIKDQTQTKYDPGNELIKWHWLPN